LEFLFSDSADFLEKFDKLPEYPAAVVLGRSWMILLTENF
jgi:hypothetical protein